MTLKQRVIARKVQKPDVSFGIKNESFWDWSKVDGGNRKGI